MLLCSSYPPLGVSQHAITGINKLSSPWEGPFIISRALSNNAYYIIDMREPRKDKGDTSYHETERPWNAELLCPFYT